jgi:hypothetical protein
MRAVLCALRRRRPIFIIWVGVHMGAAALSRERERELSLPCALSERRPSPPRICVKVPVLHPYVRFGTDARLDSRLLDCMPPIPAAAVLKVQLKESLLLNVQSA